MECRIFRIKIRNVILNLVNANNPRGGFTDGRRVNESEPSPVSEQIEHTKTECLYAKLCEREVNPRQLISGAEHTSQNAKELLEEGNNNKINCNIHRASGRVSAL